MKNLKKLLVLTAFSFLLFSFSNCSGTKNISEMKLEQNPPFTIASATHQYWIAGIEGGGSGINVTVTLASKEAGVTLKEIYFNDGVASLTATENGGLRYTASFKTDLNSGDSTIMDIDPQKEAKNTPPKKIPFVLAANEAVINYSFNGKMAYFKIDNMIRKESVSYPGTNPNNNKN